MIDIFIKPTKKQDLVLNLLFNESKVTDILFGGSAGGGKSYVACIYILIMCLRYPGTRYAICRDRLNKIKKSTLKTFFDLTKSYGLYENTHFKYNRSENLITFSNGSEIYLISLFQNPSDQDFEQLGSIELTSVVIDEASEITEMAFDILKSRLRYKLNEYNLSPKILICSNPSRGWLYDRFYKRYIENTLEEYQKYIPALPIDNPHLDPRYIIQLERLTGAAYQRLYLGNWSYADDENDLFDIEDIHTSFVDIKSIKKDKYYISVDVASQGGDKTIISVWNNLKMINILIRSKLDTNLITDLIKNYQRLYKIPNTNIIIDANGVGCGVADNFKYSYRFMAQSSPTNNIYSNLKSQCGYKLSELIKNGEIQLKKCDDDQASITDSIIKQLIAHKKYKSDQDVKLQITPKPIVKQMISESPDIFDNIMMLMVFFLENKNDCPKLSYSIFKK